MNKILVVWDWDGTLADTFETLFASHCDVCTHFNKPLFTREEVSKMVCGEITESWGKLFPTQEERSDAGNYYEQRRMLHLQDKTKAFPETKEVLTWLYSKGISQIIISNQFYDTLIMECDKLECTQYFQKIHGTIYQRKSRNLPQIRKPMKEFLDQGLEGISYDKMIVIGDGLSDVKMAQALGATCILIKANPPEFEEHYDVCVKNLGEAFEVLKKYILKLSKKD